MDISTNAKRKRRYFAAQNSYRGFLSHFKTVFNSKDYSRIFVLKGGPGTGKSSFMKDFSASLEKKCEITEILCSSDPNSLDGVIAKNGKYTVAVLDGTAPHERDAAIPGAIDELVNLGDFWSVGSLIDSREEILELNDEKSSCYKSAYRHLESAGKYDALARAETLARFDSYPAREYAQSLLKTCDSGEKANRGLLLSAFGKSGRYTIKDALSDAEECYQIAGEYSSADVFMRILAEEAAKSAFRREVYSSPLSPDSPEAIIVSNQEKRICYTVLECKNKLSVNRFLRKIPDSVNLQLKHFEKRRTEYELLAKDSFESASAAHFKLEKIYTPLMNFEKMKSLSASVKEKARQMLE